jgi:hypothetical protein
MKLQVFNNFKYYLGLQKYNYALKYDSQIVDVPLLEQSLYKYLELKENVEIHCDSEITSMVKEKGIVTSVLCSGSKNK